MVSGLLAVPSEAGARAIRPGLLAVFSEVRSQNHHGDRHLEEEIMSYAHKDLMDFLARPVRFDL